MLNLLDAALSFTPMVRFVIANLETVFHTLCVGTALGTRDILSEVFFVPRTWVLFDVGLCSHYLTKLPLSPL
jgi:hypothetical protein